jgi:transcriptional regulator with XRE-family HTH domain
MEQDYSQRLQRLMQQAGLTSYRRLSEAAGVSRSSLALLRQGQVGRLQVASVQQLALALGVSPGELLAQFDRESPDPEPTAAPAPAALQQEYHRLTQQLEAQAQQIRQQVQGEAIATLEPWLLQWPTAAHAAQQNDTLPASRLLPLTKPIEALLHRWQLTPIGPVGAEVPYDPQQHQVLGATPAPGHPVRIRYVGYYHGDRLLYRAKVSPVMP